MATEAGAWFERYSPRFTILPIPLNANQSSGARLPPRPPFCRGQSRGRSSPPPTIYLENDVFIETGPAKARDYSGLLSSIATSRGGQIASRSSSGGLPDLRSRLGANCSGHRPTVLVARPWGLRLPESFQSLTALPAIRDHGAGPLRPLPIFERAIAVPRISVPLNPVWPPQPFVPWGSPPIPNFAAGASGVMRFFHSQVEAKPQLGG